MKIHQRISALFLAAVLSGGIHAEAQVSFIPLGDLPGGMTNSAAYGVSADGSVVVGSSVSSNGVVAFRWTQGGGMVALPLLPFGTSAVAYAASANGSIIVGGGSSAYGLQACMWSNGVVNGLSDLDGGSSESSAFDVSDNGEVIVGYGTSASGREAFRWTGGPMMGLGDLASGGFQSEARAISPDGAMIAGYGTATSESIFTWDSVNLMQNYYSSARALGLSAGGNHVVGYVKATYVIPNIITLNYWRAARWNAGVATIIGPESSGELVNSWFSGVTDDGSIAVGSFKSSAAGPFRAVSHDSINGVRYLKTFLEEEGIDMTGWELADATAVSADGSVVVGYGSNPAGQQEAWMITGFGLNLQLRWVGNNSHWPTNGSLTAADDLWMNIDSKDQGIGVTGVVVYSTDKGSTWKTQPLIEGTPGADFDHWYRNLGSFPAGTTIRYSLAVEDADGYQVWDNNQGRDYYAVVNPGSVAPVAWVGNDPGNGTVAHAATNLPLQSAPSVLITGVTQNVKHLLARELQPNYPYVLQMAGTLDAWSPVASVEPTGTNSQLSVTNGTDLTFYRLSAAATSTYIVITREVWPQDTGKAARMGYRLNGGDWSTRDLNYAGQVGNNDVWKRTIGPVAPGTTIEYFVEVISAHNGGFSYFDNNDNNNYSFTVP